MRPKGVEVQLGISPPTRWRMERDGRLPPRDFFIGGIAVGWKPTTLAAAFGRAGCLMPPLGTAPSCRIMSDYRGIAV